MYQEAKQIVSCVRYEWQMLLWTSQQLRAADGKSSDGFFDAALEPYFLASSLDDRLTSSLLESFLIHARVLRDFFWQDKPRQDDVVASHFFDAADEWISRRLEMEPYLNANKDRLNKALAHLTYGRLIYADKLKEWDVSTITAELQKTWQSFLGALPAVRRAWFE